MEARQGCSKDTATPCEVRGELNEYKRERSRGLRKQRKYMAVLRNDHTSRSLNSFNERFAIPFLILCSHFPCT